MNAFIQLNRAFRKLNTSEEQTDESYKISLAFGTSSHIKWDDLIKHPRVIILAEAGAGKTQEFEQITTRLNNEGQLAFFLRLEHLSDNLETAFEIGDFQKFKEWLNQDGIAHFFLDSVDEAKLVDPRQFHRAIKVFRARIGEDNLHRIRICISSRITRWLPKSDLALINRHLPFETIKNSDEVESDLADSTPKPALQSEPNKVVKAPEMIAGEPMVVSMLGLDGLQMKTYALEKGLTESDADRMISEIFRLELIDLASRPKDLDDILGFWKAEKKVGSRLELIRRSFKDRVLERDPNRGEIDPLSIEKTQYGAQKLASAVTFQQMNRILVPESEPITEGVDASQILNEWTSKEIQALLQRPLFEEQTYGTVRFYHRSVREFLTAEWLNNLLLNGKSRRDIEALFFRKQYGLDVVIPTSRPVLSWMVLLDPQIRERAHKIAPEVFIQSGDATQLPLETRKSLLTQMCETLATTGFGRTYFSNTELYRLGKTDMGETVCSLIHKFQDNDEIVDVLIVIATQRNIDISVELAKSIILDQARSEYTRTKCLDYLRANHRKSLQAISTAIVSDTSYKNQKILSWLVEHYNVVGLEIDEIVCLLSRFLPRPEFRYDRSYEKAIEMVKMLSVDLCHEFADKVYPLLKTEPLIERDYLEISQKYKWLYIPTMLALNSLIKAKDKRALDARFLELLSYSIRSHDFHDFHDTKDLHKELAKVIPEYTELNDALFWFSIQAGRTEGSDVQTVRGGKFWRHNWDYKNDDFSRVLDWVNTKTLLDDRLVALDLAFILYVGNGRGEKRRRQLWKAVTGKAELEEKLKSYLHPKPQSKDTSNWKRRERRWKKQRENREKEKAQNLKEWQKYLSSNEADKMLDNSVATDGRTYNGHNYLMQQALKEQGIPSKRAKANWKSLIPTYGERAAKRYRDSAVDYWRRWEPTETNNSGRTTYATIFGLTGLRIEADETQDWAKHLSKPEAIRAMQYAHCEMNGFPEWLESLYEHYPEIVIASLVKGIEHEFIHRKEEENYYGTLNAVTWSYPWLYCALAPHIILLIKKYKYKHSQTILNALGIILQCEDSNPTELAELAKTEIAQTNDLHTIAIWYATWMGAHAEEALPSLKIYVEQLEENQRTNFVMDWLILLLGDRHEHLRSKIQTFKTVPILTEMYFFVFEHIRMSEDIDRTKGGAYSPTQRDNAQSARSSIFSMLSSIPGRATFDAFIELSKSHPEESHRPWYVHHARERAEKDADIKAWEANDFTEFEHSAKRRPKNHQELFDLARSRLLDLKVHLENGDDSQAEMLKNEKRERIHRNYFAERFRERRNGMYNVSQEEEMADAKKPDLRLHTSNVDCPVPIELKIADSWTGPEIFERLENQLCGDYLRDARSSRGIFLIVNRGSKKHWILTNGEKMDFQQLIDGLNKHIETLYPTLTHIEEVQVIGIDLSIRL